MASKHLQGHLLLASTQLLDPNFARSVVLIVQHSDDGALGLILNRPSDTQSDDAWHSVAGEPCALTEPLYHGGPCQGPLMVLHGDAAASQVEVCDGVHFTSDEQDVRRLVHVAVNPAKFCVGYAGWSPLQLDGELETGSWLAVPATAQEIYEPDQQQWERLMRMALQASALGGLNPKIIPRDPSMN